MQHSQPAAADATHYDLVDQLIGWLIGQLVIWLTGCLVDWLIDLMID